MFLLHTDNTVDKTGGKGIANKMSDILSQIDLI